MTELKSFNSERIYWAVEQVEQEAGDIADLHLDDNLFYLKSEVDKVIADLVEKNKRLARKDIIMASNAIEEVYSELYYNKYKRCLNMAKWCFTKSNYHFVLARHGEDIKENNRRSILYSKWRNRWLGIAEKFKETNK